MIALKIIALFLSSFLFKTFIFFFRSAAKFCHAAKKVLEFLIKLIIQEIIIEKCQNCVLTQTFRVYNPSSV